MSPETVNFWANVAAIYLFINAIIITIITAVGLGFAWWYLRKGRKALDMPFLYAQVYALRAQRATMVASEKIVAVPVAIGSTAERAMITTKTLFRGKDRKDETHV